MVRHFRSDAAQMRWSYLSSLFVFVVQWVGGALGVARPAGQATSRSQFGTLRPATRSTWGAL